ncbi:MAG TPA: hypothetical protein VIK04_00110 [Solirubrobacteraceae bacterium]
MILLVIGGRRLIVGERTTTVSPAAVRVVIRSLVAVVVAVVVVAVIAVALSHRGLGGTASHAWSSFTTARAAAGSGAAGRRGGRCPALAI